MPAMLEFHYFRFVLLTTNFPAMIISYILAGRGYYFEASTFFWMAIFLTVSLAQNLSILCFVLWKKRAGRSKGYFRLPITTTDASHEPAAESIGYSGMGPGTVAAIIISDLMLGLGLVVTVPFASTVAFTDHYRATAGVACMGGLFATVVHLFFVLLATDFGAIGKYRLKVQIVRRGEETDLRGVPRRKEESTSEEASHHEPEHITPRQYRGSPSTKVTKIPDSPRTGPIRLIEPTEGDSLIASHD